MTFLLSSWVILSFFLSLFSGLKNNKRNCVGISIMGLKPKFTVYFEKNKRGKEEKGLYINRQEETKIA
jgi:hypothetical protein